MNRVGLFIDGANLSIEWHKISSGQVDFAKLLLCIERLCDGSIDEAYCFDATENGRTNPYFSAMQRAGIRVKLYEFAFEDVYDARRVRIVDTSGDPVKRRIQKGVDVGLATHMLESHRRRGWTKLVLAAADADFAEPVQRLVEIYGVELTILGIPEKASYALQPYATRFIDLRKIVGSVQRQQLAAIGRPTTLVPA
jgi:uncharacterized LabA/DUF88 family protein